MATPEELAVAVADAARAVPAVADLSESVATHLPGRRVEGVRVEDDAATVAVVVRLDDRPLPEVAEEVRAAVAPAADGRRVDVVVDDVVPAGPVAAEPEPPPPAG